MYRWSSSSSIPKASATTSPAPSPALPGAEPPTDPLPSQGSRPHDVLINRCHEIKRISKSLAGYFEGVAQAHHAHSLTLTKLSGATPIQTPLAESSLFIPASTPISGAPTTPNGTPAAGSAGTGWAELLVQTKETNKAVAEGHAELARTVSKEVVVPLKKLRGEMKAHIGNLEKEVGKLAEAVLKERDTSMQYLTMLTTSLTPSTGPVGPASHAPSAPVATQDPVLLRSLVETQMKTQVSKENEMLQSVISWTERTEKKEKEVWAEVGRCWGVWEQANSNMLLGNQGRSMVLSAGVDSVAPETEWSHFVRLNHTIPSDTPARSTEIADLEFPGKESAMTLPLKEGMLERQKRIMKSWTSGYYLLTPTGHLHIYPTSSTPRPNPSSSIYLPHCTLGPMPTPEASSKGKQLEALFTIEAADGTKHVLRAKSWEELGGWWEGLSQFTKVAPVPDISTLDADAAPPVALTPPPGVDDEEEAEAQRAAAQEAAKAELTSEEREEQEQREMERKQELERRQAEEAEDGGDIGASAAKGPPPSLPPRAVPPPPTSPPALPPRSAPEISTPEHEPQESDIGFHLDSPKSPPILTESPDAPPTSEGMDRVPSL